MTPSNVGASVDCCALGVSFIHHMRASYLRGSGARPASVHHRGSGLLVVVLLATSKTRPPTVMAVRKFKSTFIDLPDRRILNDHVERLRTALVSMRQNVQSWPAIRPTARGVPFLIPTRQLLTMTSAPLINTQTNAVMFYRDTKYTVYSDKGGPSPGKMSFSLSSSSVFSFSDLATTLTATRRMRRHISGRSLTKSSW